MNHHRTAKNLTKFQLGAEFQTPPEIAEYMCRMIPVKANTILEPTAGQGNILRFLEGYDVTAPDNFFELDPARFDCIVMNPPYSEKYTFGIPKNYLHKGMRVGYQILLDCLEMSDYVIALLPFFVILDSDVRMRHLKSFGIKSITALPRKTFKYVRIQTAVFEFVKGWKEETLFKTFELLDIPQPETLNLKLETQEI